MVKQLLPHQIEPGTAGQTLATTAGETTWIGNVAVLIENGATEPPAGTPVGAIIFEKGA